jgi:hypothetical protein
MKLGSYYFGTTRVDKLLVTQRLDLRPIPDSERPGAATGRLLRGADGKLRYCQDGTNFEVLVNE